MHRRVLAGRFPATTFCQGSKDMPTQSRGHGTRRERIRGLMRPGLFSARRARFVKPPAKTKRISRRGAEHAEKDKGIRFDLRLLPFVAPQTFEIVSACEDFIERSGFSPSPVLAFSACSAPLREILPSPLAGCHATPFARGANVDARDWYLRCSSFRYDLSVVFRNRSKEARTMNRSYRSSLLLAMDEFLPPGFFRSGPSARGLAGRPSG